MAKQSKHTNRLLRWSLVLLLVNASLFCLGAAQAEPGPRYEEKCPLQSSDIKVSLPRKVFPAEPGQVTRVALRADPLQPPAGFYYSVIVDVLQAPDGAEPVVVSGMPEIRITTHQVGNYLFRIRVSLIAKSSCGGAKASILLEEKIRLNVS